jgi:hypothetical protein
VSVEELESAVSQLSASELARFSEWFAEFAADQWDRQIEEDLRAGRLDAAIKRADDHYEAGRCTPLDIRNDKTKEQMTSEDWDEFARHIGGIRAR